MIENCIRALQDVLGETARPEELEALYSQMRKAIYSRLEDLVQNENYPRNSTALIEAARRLGDEKKMLSFVAKRNAAINALKNTENLSWIDNVYPGNASRGAEAVLSGVISDKPGTRNGAMQLQQGLKRDWRAALQGRLDKAGVWELLKKGDPKFDESVHEAWYDMFTAAKEATWARVGPKAVAAAQALEDIFDHGRLLANDAGAFIGKLDNWALRNTHNQELITHMGEERYTQLLTETLNLPKMMARMQTNDQAAMLKELYRHQAFNVHEKAAPNPFIGDVGMLNTAKQISHSRVFEFKDAASAWRYNREAGGTSFSPHSVWAVKWENNQSLLNAALRQLDLLGDATGLMQKLGPNATANATDMVLKTLPERLSRIGGKAAEDQNKRLAKDADWLLEKLLPNINGEAQGVANKMGARIGQAWRNWESSVDLGMMLLSQFSDPVQHMEGSHYWGRGWFAGLHDVGIGLTTNFKGDPFARQLASSLGVMFDHFGGEVMRAGSFDVPGSTSRMMQLFYKMNGANWWNTHMSYSAAHGNANYLASFAGQRFEELPKQMQRVLAQYDITPANWQSMRAAELMKRADGKDFMVPDQMPGPVAAKYKTMMIDQTTFSQLEPDAKTMAYILRGSKAGDIGGELLRSAMQFKSFNAAFTQKTIGRTLFGHGYEHEGNWFSDAGKALVSGHGEFWGMADIILLTTALGYMSKVAKDAVKGIAPADPNEMTGLQLAGLWFASALQGSGLGVFGDLVFSPVNRAGGGLGDTILGPNISRVTSLHQHYGELRDELLKGNLRPALKEQAYKAAYGAIPGNNLFWIKGTMDYGLNWRMREWINPGTLYKNEQRMQRERDQHMFIQPRTGFGPR